MPKPKADNGKESIMENTIKCEHIPAIRENSERARQIRLAQEYRHAVAESKAEHKKHTRENIVCICMAVCLLAIVVALFVKAFVTPSGYYRATDTMQPDGTYYEWVEPLPCKVVEVEDDLVIVSYKGKEYDFIVCTNDTYKVGEKVYGIFTSDMELVDIEK